MSVVLHYLGEMGGVMLLGETLTWQAALGGAMIIGSIFLVNMTEGKA